jgi:hypothetical protein
MAFKDTFYFSGTIDEPLTKQETNEIIEEFLTWIAKKNLTYHGQIGLGDNFVHVNCTCYSCSNEVWGSSSVVRASFL